MKTRILSLILLAFISNIYATQRVVQENGPVGTYGSIQSAIDAASNGDEIVVNNKASGLPWTGTVTINKSLSLISAVIGVKFLVQGDFIVVPADGRKIQIIGMKNHNLHVIKSDDTANTSNRTQVSVMASVVNALVFNNEGFFITATGNDLNYIRFTAGHIIGNEIHAIQIQPESAQVQETMKIIGNKMLSNGLSYYSGLSGSSPIHFYHAALLNEVMISNNYIIAYGSAIEDDYNSNITTIHIVNNSIQKGTYSSTSGAIELGSNLQQANVVNNWITAGFEHCIETLASNTVFQYNYYGNSAIGVVIDPSNVGNSAYTTATTQNNNNAGNPSNLDLDLDLSANDVGCFGGSYSLDNFHPIEDGKTSKVYDVNMPRMINSGDLFDVTGEAYSK